MSDDWAAAIEDYTRAMRAGGRTPQTIALRRHYLRRLAADIGGHPYTATAGALQGFLAEPHWRPETRNSARSSVRGFYQWAARMGLRPDDPSSLLERVRVPPAAPKPAPDDVLTRGLLRSRRRERLMLKLAAWQGLRRTEIARLHTDDLIGDELRVTGKGGVVRMLPIHPDLLDDLLAVPAGYVFPGGDRGHLSPERVGNLIRLALGPGWSAHTLRHRFATLAYSAERDLRAVQELLGHASVATTQRYVRVPDGARRAAVLAAGRTAQPPVPGRRRRSVS